MLTRFRGGFTLTEIMIALALTLGVAGTLHRLLVSTQRVTRAQGQRVELQSSVRAGALIVLSELRELSAFSGGTEGQNDILVAGPTVLVYRAMRGIGFSCGTPDATAIRLARGTFTGHRDPQAGRDEALVFLEDRAASGVDDIWRSTAIVSVATGVSCPGALGPGLTLTLPAGAPADALVPGLEPGTPVRITEVMELRLYESEGRSWLGARSLSSGEAIQPLVGPLSRESGFRLEYLDAAGAPTADRTSIRSIRVALRGTTEGGGAGNSSPVEEELIGRVALRNAAQP